jgi:CheY-like chemotaxis protein
MEKMTEPLTGQTTRTANHQLPFGAMVDDFGEESEATMVAGADPDFPGAKTAARRTALVVDDEFLIASMIEDILAREGMEVLTAMRTDDAVNFVREQRVDFALIDYQMHASSSEALWTELRARQIPFAFCTGSAMGEMGERFPGVLIIGKPFGEEEILQAARALMR